MPYLKFNKPNDSSRLFGAKSDAFGPIFEDLPGFPKFVRKWKLCLSKWGISLGSLLLILYISIA